MPRKYSTSNPLLAIAQSKGFKTILELAAKMPKTSSSQLAPSNLGTTSLTAPIFGRLAKALDMSVEELRPVSREGTGLSPRKKNGDGEQARARKNKLQRIWRAKQKREKETSQAVKKNGHGGLRPGAGKRLDGRKRRPWGSVTRKGQRLAPKAGTTTLSVVHVPNANDGHSTNGTNGHGSRAYHKRVLGILHELPKETRETVKTFINTLNRGIMLGEPMMPPIPIVAARVLLEDYLHEKGVKINVLLDPEYYEVFGR